MKLLVLGAVIGALMMGAVPASAESARIVVGDRDNGVVVREHTDRGRHEGWRHQSWRHHHAECRVVKVRTTLPNGNVIVKTRQTCD